MKAGPHEPDPSGKTVPQNAVTLTPITATPPAPARTRAAPAAPPSAAHGLRKKLILAGLGLAALALAAYFGIPILILALNTVSTDDAYVNGHFTFVAARVPGQIKKVHIDDNKPVKKGKTLLVQLDKEPYQVQVNLKKATLEKSKADLEAAKAQVEGMAAQARGNRFKLEHTIELVKSQVGQLSTSVEGLKADLAVRDRAKGDFDRVNELTLTKGATTQQELDLKLQDYLVAKAKVRQSLETIYQLRSALGLETAPVDADKITIATVPKNLKETPDNLDQTFSAVRQAAAEMMQSAAPLGISVGSFDLLPGQILDQFYARDPLRRDKGEPTKDSYKNALPGAVDRILREVISKAPPILQAIASVEQAQKDLDQADLNLRYTDVYAEIDGVITRRSVNEGNNVQAGQSLMVIRSVTEIWIDANFKETQLADLKIGQKAKIEVDMYGDRHEFNGRITGFTMGTGQTLSLLPPQNATGNYVKIVQRLPVKIELFDYNPYDPKQQPLLIGLSTTPYIYFREPLVGDDPDKGKVLQSLQSLPVQGEPK